MKKQLLVMTIGLAASGVALAEDYQVELEGGIDRIEVDGADDSINQYNFAARYYFAPVDTSGKPLAEAAFLNRASNIVGAISHASEDGNDVTGTMVGGEFYIPNTMFYVAADYVRLDGDFVDGDAWSVTGGITPIEGLRLTTTYVEDVDYDPNIAAKYVMLLNGDRALNLYGDVTVGDDDTFYTAGMDYYFTPKTSIGFVYEDATGDASDLAQEWGVNAKHFFTENAYGGVHYTTSDFADEVGFEVGMRF